MTSPIQITHVVRETDRRKLLSFPYSLYRNDQNWIPRLWPEQLAWLHRETGFFQQADADWFLAHQDSRVSGSIGVAIDHLANRNMDRRWGIFGFFEFVQDDNTFRALIERARAWMSMRGMTHMIGPRSFSPNDYPGFLLGRYDLPPALYEGHSPPYYADFAETAGWGTYQDSIAYRAFRVQFGDRLEFLNPKMLKVAQRVARNPRVAIRHANLEAFEQEFKIFLQIYNRSLGTLPEFVPHSEEEFREFAYRMLPALDEELITFALVDGVEVAFSLALPNLAEAFHRCNGLRYPWNYLQLWLATRRIRSVSYKILATDPEYWGLGLEALMFQRLAEVCLARGYEWMDCSLTAGDNPNTNKLAKRMNFEEYKRYRTYLVEVE